MIRYEDERGELTSLSSPKRSTTPTHEQRVTGYLKRGPCHITCGIRCSGRSGSETRSSYERAEPSVAWSARRSRENDRAVRIDECGPVKEGLGDPRHKGVEKIFHALTVKHSRRDIERLVEWKRKTAHHTADVFDIDPVNQGKCVQQCRYNGFVDELEGEFVDRAPVASLKDVNSDEIAPDVTDSGRESAERSRPVRKPDPHDVTRHGATLRSTREH